MQLTFKSTKLEREFSDEKRLKKVYGEQAAVIMRRLAVLEAATNLAMVPVARPERCHLMTGDRAGKFAVDLKQPYRLVFEPNPPVPRLPDGSIDRTRVTAVVILEVVDYH